MQQFGASFGAAADCELDEGGADRAAVIGLAIIADGAQIGEVVVAHEVLIGAGEIGVDHAHGDGEWIRLYHVVGVLEVHGMPAVEQLRGEWRNRDCSVDRSVVEGDGVLCEGNDLDLDVVESEPVALEELADLIGRHRALAVGGDGLTLELPQPGDLAFEVGAQHQVVAERARDAIEHHRDRQILFQRVEIAGGNPSLYELQLVLRQKRDRVGGGVEVFGDNLDAMLLEVALFHAPQNGGGGNRAHRADFNRDLLRIGREGGGNDGERGEQSAPKPHAVSPLARMNALM